MRNALIFLIALGLLAGGYAFVRQYGQVLQTQLATMQQQRNEPDSPNGAPKTGSEPDANKPAQIEYLKRMIERETSALIQAEDLLRISNNRGLPEDRTADLAARAREEEIQIREFEARRNGDAEELKRVARQRQQSTEQIQAQKAAVLEDLNRRLGETQTGILALEDQIRVLKTQPVSPELMTAKQQLRNSRQTAADLRRQRDELNRAAKAAADGARQHGSSDTIALQSDRSSLDAALTQLRQQHVQTLKDLEQEKAVQRSARSELNRLQQTADRHRASLAALKMRLQAARRLPE